MPLDDAPPPASLAERIEALGLEHNVRQLEDDGYTVIYDPKAGFENGRNRSPAHEASDHSRLSRVWRCG